MSIIDATIAAQIRTPEDRSIKAIPRILLRIAAGVAAFLFLAFAALVLWLRYDALPHADRYRGYIVSSIERASGMAVKASAIHGGWEGLRPRVSLEGFELADREGRVALALQRAEVTLSWWALFRARLRFHDVDFYRPQLVLRRGKDGLVYLADRPLNRPGPEDEGALGGWLLAQPRLAIHDATLTWRDELTGAPEVTLTRVEIAVHRRLGRHHAALTALPPAALSGRIDVRADLRVRRVNDRWSASGEVFAEGIDTDLGGLRAHLPVPEALRSAVGSLRVWATLSDNALTEVVADVNARDATAQLASDALPLTLASISGRAAYRAKPDGFSLETHGLRFRLPNGEEARPGDFSLVRTMPPGRPPHVEVRADGIDLKIAAALIDYFPVPRDIKAQIDRFAPRGRISHASLAWNGEDVAKARTYTVKGRFEDLGVNPVDAWPGVTGMSGSLEGSDRGGTIDLDATHATFALANVFRAPIPLDALHVKARWRHAGDALEVALDEARFSNADAQGELSGTWRSLPDSPQHSPGYVDLKGRLTRAAVNRVANYLPNQVATTRDWLERSVQAGTSDKVRFEVRGDLQRFPFGDGGDGRFLVEGDIHDGRLQYHPEWPAVDAIQGSFRFENRRIEIHAQEARIFRSKATGVSAVIAQLGVRPLLTIDGEVVTTGAEGVRFLRESPLVNGPGAFTRAIAIEGPGRLKLHLEFPLGGTGRVQVAGDYQFSGATASVGRDLALANMNGHLSFTQDGVRAPGIEGTLFGEPARLTMSTQADGRVLTTLEAHMGGDAIARFVPASIARHLTGTADWKAVILSDRNGTGLTVSSDLVGMGVDLPLPFSKAPDEARPIVVSIAQLDAPGEMTTVSLEGGVQGRFTRETQGGVDRWSAALGFGTPVADAPRREGVWLYGKLATLDVDAWQKAFEAAPGEAAPEGGDADRARRGLELRGLDLTLDKVRYLDREFSAMHATLVRDSGRWSGRLESPKVAGDVVWDPAGKGSLVAHFARLSVAEAAHAAHAEPQPHSNSELPALDISAERFEFRGHGLGRLDLKALPAGDEWRIERLDIASDHAKFTSSGGWRRTAEGPLTTLSVKLASDNLNALLGLFGYGDYLKRGDGSLEGTLVWPGYPYDFALASLAGHFKLDAHRGQFAKIEAGAGKLLGLISLQSLPRRAMLDFRDVFSEGFAFDRIHGNVKVARGVLLTDDFEISGPAAFVAIGGEASLPAETQELILRVVPEVSEGIALAATLIGTPVLGLSTLLVSKLLKNPLGKVVAYEYRVTGSWDNPEVTRLSGPAPKAAAATP
ncbi:MAG TPA: YhdP family protein [Usitatibacter sp.]|nr:YhdP family protein [Usitatibacter sp.]